LLLGLPLATFFFLGLNLSLGTVSIPMGQVFRFLLFQHPENATTRMILANIRLPRVLLGMCVGATLAVSGNLFQALLRNPLADPYILGVSSGGAFGTVLTIALFGSAGTLPSLFTNVPVMAFAFSLGTAFTTYAIAKRGSRLPVVDLILSGVIMNFLFGSATTFVIVFGWRNVQSATFWLLGSLSGSTWSGVWRMLPVALGGFFFSWALTPSLNAISLGEDEAASVGVNVEVLKTGVFILGTLLSAYSVTAAGMVGFVGLIIPHTARLLVGPNHRVSIPASALLGAIFLSLCDSLARWLFQPTEMPLGTITSLVGAPIFIILLRRNRRGF